MELENSRPTAADRGENSRTPQGRKEKTRRGRKTGKKPAKQGRFRRFLPRFSFFLPFFLSSRRGKRNADGEEREIHYPDFQTISTKDEHFLERERKRSCNFLWKFKTLSVYSRCGCPFPTSLSQNPKDGDDERPAPRLLLTRQIGVRTPAGRPQDPMGWLELRPLF